MTHTSLLPTGDIPTAADAVHFDGWRIGWTLDGRLCNPLRGRGTDGGGVTKQLLRMRRLTMSHGWEWEAECHTRGSEQVSRPASLPDDHQPPHPDCYCGIHACDRLEMIVHLAKSLDDAAGLVRDRSREFRPDRVPPGIALYRVELLDHIERAVYIHANVEKSAGWWHDPPGTWRAARARVIGPIIATTEDEDEQQDMADRYEVTVYHLGSDINDVMARLQTHEPPKSPEPCPECRYRAWHAAECSHFHPWWAQADLTDRAL